MDISRCLRSRLRRGLVVAALLAGSATAADAALVVSIRQPSGAAAGSTANTLEVDLTNNGPSAVAIGGFAFELTANNSAVTFTGATTATASRYIFAGNSFVEMALMSSDISTGTSSNPPTIDASDNVFTPLSGTTIGSGATYGLGLVSFNVAARASSQSVTIQFTGSPSTSLSDPLGNDVVIDSLMGVTFQISAGTNAVPEPATILLTGSGLAIALAHSRRHRPQS